MIDFESKIEKQYEKLAEGWPYEEQVEIYIRLANLYELYIEHLKEKLNSSGGTYNIQQ